VPQVIAHATKGAHLNAADLSHRQPVEGMGTVKSVLRPLNDIVDEELFLLVCHVYVRYMPSLNGRWLSDIGV
jgi:hypothetical protein